MVKYTLCGCAFKPSEVEEFCPLRRFQPLCDYSHVVTGPNRAAARLPTDRSFCVQVDAVTQSLAIVFTPFFKFSHATATNSGLFQWELI